MRPVVCKNDRAPFFYVFRTRPQKNRKKEQGVFEKVSSYTENVRVAARDTDFLTNSVNPLIRFLSRLAQAGIPLIPCVRMLTGAMSLGIAQAFFQYITLAAEPLRRRRT